MSSARHGRRRCLRPPALPALPAFPAQSRLSYATSGLSTLPELEKRMHCRTSRVVVALAVAAGVLGVPLRTTAQTRPAVDAAATHAPARAWVTPRTPDGQPDLQGIWDYRTVTPLERPPQFKDKAFLTDEEVADYERRAAARVDGRPPDDPRTDPSVQPPDWLDYGKKMVGGNRSSLIVDPPDGRIPPLTAEGQARAAARRSASQARGPADDPENRTSVGALHHARASRRRAARRVQQQHPDLPDAGLRGPADGDDPRRAHRPARRPAAPAAGTASGWATRAGAGKATRSSSRRSISPTGRTSADPQSVCTWSSDSRARAPTRWITVHRRGSDDVDEAVDGRASAGPE